MQRYEHTIDFAPCYHSTGSDWHRLGRLLGLNSDDLEEIGKFKNFDLTSRVEKVIFRWVKVTKEAGVEDLRLALDKMDRNLELVGGESDNWSDKTYKKIIKEAQRRAVADRSLHQRSRGI